MDYSNSSKKEIRRFYKAIADNVRHHRTTKRYSQLDLALEIGISSVAFYSNCENVRYDKHFNLEHLYKIAKALDICVCDIIKPPSLV